MFIKRNNDLEDMISSWSPEKPSKINLNNLKRNKDLLISKRQGRSDLILINYGQNQYCFEAFSGWHSNTPDEVKKIGYKEIAANFEEFLRSLHYLHWLRRQEIIDMTYDEVLAILNQGLNSFNYTEAVELFNSLKEDDSFSLRKKIDLEDFLTGKSEELGELIEEVKWKDVTLEEMLPFYPVEKKV